MVIGNDIQDSFFNCLLNIDVVIEARCGPCMPVEWSRASNNMRLNQLATYWLWLLSDDV